MFCMKCGSDNLTTKGACRACLAAKMRAWLASNKDRVNLERRLRYRENPEPKRARDRKYLETRRSELNERRRGERNKVQNAKARARKREWYLANRARIAVETKARVEARKAADPEAFRSAVNARARRRRQIDPRRRFHEKVSRLVSKTLKRHRTSKQGKTWPALLGYGIAELEARLLSTMPAGCDWNDYLCGALEIDHIVPASVHNFASPNDIDFKRCWALSNLRLLPKQENYEKRAKLLAPFQPALLLAELRGAVE